MMRTALGALLLSVAVTPVVLGGDDQNPHGGNKASGGSTSDVKGTRTPATLDQLKAVVAEAIKLIQALADDASKSERELRLPTPATFQMQLSKDIQADALRALGKALAAIGDRAGAKSALQSAADIAGEIQGFGEPTKRAEIYVEIAKAQMETGEKAEAQFTLRQAMQSARTIPGGSPFSIQPPPGMEFDYDPMAKKSMLLKRIAQIQAAGGDQAASADSYRQAVETASSLGQPMIKVRALAEIAQVRSMAAAAATWKIALDTALAVDKEYTRAKAVEFVLREQIKNGLYDEAIGAVADRLKGDSQNYGLWVVADAIAASEQTVPPAAMDRLKGLVGKAEFDRQSKKIKVFERLAAALARLGDYDGAYRTSGEPHPLNNVQDFRATQARVNVMKCVAEAQIKAKQLTAAKDTIQAALEIFAPLDDEDEETYFPLAALGDLQVKAGDLAGAQETAKSLTFTPSRIGILIEVAVAYSRLGRRGDARQALERAAKEAEDAPRDALWRATMQSGDIGEGFDPLAFALQTIAQGQARIGDLDGALKTVARISSSGFGKFARRQATEQIVSASLDAGDVPGARKSAEIIPDSESMSTDEKAGLLERIAKYQSEKNDPAVVIEWAKKEPIPNTKLQVLRGLADGIAERYASKRDRAKSAEASDPSEPAK
jgi:tetratricopeptide (TPR) repeat protein